jgi:biopolymer transport protein ExbD
VNFHKRTSRDENGIVLPLVALLDVIFFMLFYFMAAGSLMAPEAELAAAISAEASGPGAASSNFTSQVLYVEPDKQAKAGAGTGTTSGGPERPWRYRIGARVMSGKAELEAILRDLPKPPGIIIKAADDVNVEAVAAALEAARMSGFSKISYVAGQ